MIELSLKKYIEEVILPQYENYDQAHRVDHINTVIEQSLEIFAKVESLKELNLNMIYTIAAYHDIGLAKGRDLHHIHSGEYLMNDVNLRKWFSEEEIFTMKEAVEDHRASSKNSPRSIYGKIVSEADRVIDPKTIILRTIQHGLTHYPQNTPEEQYERFTQHIIEKYGDNGYLRLWFTETNNAQKLEQLRVIIRDPKKLKQAHTDTVSQ